MKLNVAPWIVLASFLLCSRTLAGHQMLADEQASYLSDNSQSVLFLTIGMLTPVAYPIHVPLHYKQRLGSDGVRYFVAEVTVYADGSRKNLGFVISPHEAMTAVLEEAVYRAFLKTGDTSLLQKSVQNLNVTPGC
jgi:hypothetical protein